MEFSAALDEVVREAGLTELKPKQREAIEGIVSGKDIFVAVSQGYVFPRDACFPHTYP